MSRCGTRGACAVLWRICEQGSRVLRHSNLFSDSDGESGRRNRFTFQQIAFYHILLKSIVNRSEEVVNLLLEKELEAK
jgi:hypothetical protein